MGVPLVQQQRQHYEADEQVMIRKADDRLQIVNESVDRLVKASETLRRILTTTTATDVASSSNNNNNKNNGNHLDSSSCLVSSSQQQQQQQQQQEILTTACDDLRHCIKDTVYEFDFFQPSGPLRVQACGYTAPTAVARLQHTDICQRLGAVAAQLGRLYAQGCGAPNDSNHNHIHNRRTTLPQQQLLPLDDLQWFCARFIEFHDFVEQRGLAVNDDIVQDAYAVFSRPEPVKPAPSTTTTTTKSRHSCYFCSAACTNPRQRQFCWQQRRQQHQQQQQQQPPTVNTTRTKKKSTKKDATSKATSKKAPSSKKDATSKASSKSTTTISSGKKKSSKPLQDHHQRRYSTTRPDDQNRPTMTTTQTVASTASTLTSLGTFLQHTSPQRHRSRVQAAADAGFGGQFRPDDRPSTPSSYCVVEDSDDSFNNEQQQAQYSGAQNLEPSLLLSSPFVATSGPVAAKRPSTATSSTLPALSTGTDSPAARFVAHGCTIHHLTLQFCAAPPQAQVGANNNTHHQHPAAPRRPLDEAPPRQDQQQQMFDAQYDPFLPDEESSVSSEIDELDGYLGACVPLPEPSASSTTTDDSELQATDIGVTTMTRSTAKRCYRYYRWFGKPSKREFLCQNLMKKLGLRDRDIQSLPWNETETAIDEREMELLIQRLL